MTETKVRNKSEDASCSNTKKHNNGCLGPYIEICRSNDYVVGKPVGSKCFRSESPLTGKAEGEEIVYSQLERLSSFITGMSVTNSYKYKEKAPVYTLGSAEPRSFSRGKRGIAGTMVFTSFDRDALLKGLQEYATTAAKFQRIGGELNMNPISIDEWDKQMTSNIGTSGSNLASSNAENVTTKVAKTAMPYYADEVPPFDVTISFANEYGQEAYLVIYGCEILNEGAGWSIDSIVSEKACTFVARKLKSMEPVTDGSTTTSSN